MTRLRVVGYIVQPQLMADDGETLTPLPVQPVTIPASEWPGVIEAVAGGIEQLRQQIEGHAVIPAESPAP